MSASLALGTPVELSLWTAGPKCQARSQPKWRQSIQKLLATVLVAKRSQFRVQGARQPYWLTNSRPPDRSNSLALDCLEGPEVYLRYFAAASL